MASVNPHHVPETEDDLRAKFMADGATEATLDAYLADYNKRFDTMLAKSNGSFPIYGVCSLVDNNQRKN